MSYCTPLLRGLSRQKVTPLATSLARRSMGTWPKMRPKRVRMITMDVTGTIVSFRGSLEEHYIGAATKCGIEGVDGSKINEAFGKAYRETSDRHPCFGGDELTAKQWWKECVVKSFRYAGMLEDVVHFDVWHSCLFQGCIYSICSALIPPLTNDWHLYCTFRSGNE